MILIAFVWTVVSAGLKGSQFDRFQGSQPSAGVEAGHTSALAGSYETTVLPSFDFPDKRMSRCC